MDPVQLIVLEFSHPNFHIEIIAELEQLRENDIVRVDSLAVYKANGEEGWSTSATSQEQEAIVPYRSVR